MKQLYFRNICMWSCMDPGMFTSIGDFLASLPLLLQFNRLRTVFVKVNFLKITSINTIKEEYTADVFVQIRWREPELDGTEETNFDVEKYWSPKILVSNLLVSRLSETWYHIEMSGEEAYVVQRIRIKGTFSESLELQEFPFDVQDLSVVISSEHGLQDIEIVEDHTSLSAVNVLCFVDATEWDIYDLVYSEQHHINRETPEILSRNPALAVKTVASRRSGFFIYNIIAITIIITSLTFMAFCVDVELVNERLGIALVITLTGITFKLVTFRHLPRESYVICLIMITSLTFTTFCVDVELVENRLHLSLILTLTGVTFKLVTFHLLPKIPYVTRLIMICSLSFATFSVDIEMVQNRLQLSFIITLTAVTFKQVCNQMIPRIQYLTYLDRLILGGMIFTWLTCIWHAVVSQIQDVNHKKTYDFWAFVAFIILYVAFHFIFYIVTHVKRPRRAKEVARLHKNYHIKAAKIMGQHWKSRRAVQRASVTKNNRTSMADKLQLAD